MPPATYLSKHAMFAVEVRLPVERDEELAAVGVLQQQPSQLRFVHLVAPGTNLQTQTGRHTLGAQTYRAGIGHGQQEAVVMCNAIFEVFILECACVDRLAARAIPCRCRCEWSPSIAVVVVRCSNTGNRSQVEGRCCVASSITNLTNCSTLPTVCEVAPLDHEACEQHSARC